MAYGQWRQACNVILKNLHGMQSHTITLVYVSTVIALVEKIRDSGDDRKHPGRRATAYKSGVP